MNALLREVRRSADGSPEYQDTELDAAAVTIGSAPDRAIQLLGDVVEARHAELRLSGSRVRVTSSARRPILLNDKEVRSGTLVAGDVVMIGGHRITMLEPPSGFDLALQLERDPNVD